MMYMKKTVVIAISLIVVGLVGYACVRYHCLNNLKIDLDNDWYIIVTNDFINVRREPDASSQKYGQVKEKEVYKVKDFIINKNGSGLEYFWYKIRYDNTDGWITSGEKKDYLKDYNNPNDLANPSINFLYLPYIAKDVDSIGFENLKLSDDKGIMDISYKVYREYDSYSGLSNYWIKYTVYDKSYKKTSKIGSIIFENEPKEDQVEKFEDLERE